MSQELTFAQALSEARQIIVQQSNRIKSDLEKIMALQEVISSQSTRMSDIERELAEQSAKLSEQSSQINSLSTQLEEMSKAREQAEAIIDRQGQRLTASQATIDELEREIGEKAHQIREMSGEIESLRGQLPTDEDREALASLSNLLTSKKVSVPSLGKISQQGLSGRGSSMDGGRQSSMRIAPAVAA